MNKSVVSVVCVAMLFCGTVFAGENAPKNPADSTTAATPSDSANAAAKTNLEKAKPVNLSDDTKVLVIGKNKTYHLADCQFIKQAKAKQTEADNINEITVADAVAKNFVPCKTCIDKAVKK